MHYHQHWYQPHIAYHSVSKQLTPLFCFDLLGTLCSFALVGLRKTTSMAADFVAGFTSSGRPIFELFAAGLTARSGMPASNSSRPRPAIWTGRGEPSGQMSWRRRYQIWRSMWPGPLLSCPKWLWDLGTEGCRGRTAKVYPSDWTNISFQSGSSFAGWSTDGLSG